MNVLVRHTTQVRKIVLCYEESLPAHWLVSVNHLRGKLERANIEVGGSDYFVRLYRGRGNARDLNLGVDIINASLDELPVDADIVLTTEKLAPEVWKAVPQAWIIPFHPGFGMNRTYNEIVAKLKAEATAPAQPDEVSRTW